MTKSKKGKKKYAITPSEMKERKSLEQERIELFAKETGRSVESARDQLLQEQEGKENRLLQENSNRGLSELTLISKRGTRLTKTTKCDECLTTHGTVWHYSHSSQGPVNLCARCKEIAQSRSAANSIDALDLAHTGGSFEGNRRKH